jgi:hypothetical protein
MRAVILFMIFIALAITLSTEIADGSPGSSCDEDRDCGKGELCIRPRPDNLHGHCVAVLRCR